MIILTVEQVVLDEGAPAKERDSTDDVCRHNDPTAERAALRISAELILAGAFLSSTPESIIGHI
jgi:hypothetical protein